jgi:hypothetical protein
VRRRNEYCLKDKEAAVTLIITTNTGMLQLKTVKWVYYIILSTLGLLILLLCNLFLSLPTSKFPEYHYSNLFRDNYTHLGVALFFITGFLAGYFYKLSPLIGGLSLCLVFPITAVIEAIIYPGSHNLIPFEFAIHFVFALPPVLAIAIGRFAYKQVIKHKEKVSEAAN